MLFSFSNSCESFVNLIYEFIYFDSYSSIFCFDPSYADSFADPEDLSLCTSADKRITFYSSYAVLLLLLLPLSRTLLFNYSFSAHNPFNSFLSLLIWLADNLKLSWAVLTSSPKLTFSLVKFLIFCLYVSVSSLFLMIWFLYSANSLFNLACWLAESLRLSWAPSNYLFKDIFSADSLLILFLRFSFSWLFCSILCLYSLISLCIFAFWFADNLKPYWAFLISSYIDVFSLTSLDILSWRVPIDLFISSISWSFLFKLLTYWVFWFNCWVSLSISWERRAILFSYSINLLLRSPDSAVLFFKSSFSLLNLSSCPLAFSISELSLLIWLADNLSFYWPYLTSPNRL